MPFKSILVHADNRPTMQGRLAVATALARRHDAHLVGIAVKPRLQVPAGTPVLLPQDVIDAYDARADEAAENARKSFDTALAAAGLSERSEWHQVTGDTADTLALHGRSTDLIVIGQPDPAKTASEEMLDLPDNVLIAAGRPVLVVPYVKADGATGGRIVVAWNASREATRAVHDALPLLQAAEQVIVLSADPEHLGDLPGADIAQHLARHGVTVEASHTVSDKLDIGDVLLNQVSDLGADMLVMGAYGHSRLRETVLGGATRDVLRHMTVPTLLSH